MPGSGSHEQIETSHSSYGLEEHHGILASLWQSAQRQREDEGAHSCVPHFLPKTPSESKHSAITQLDVWSAVWWLQQEAKRIRYHLHMNKRLKVEEKYFFHSQLRCIKLSPMQCLLLRLKTDNSWQIPMMQMKLSNICAVCPYNLICTYMYAYAIECVP